MSITDILHDRKIWIRTKQFCGRVKKKIIGSLINASHSYILDWAKRKIISPSFKQIYIVQL
jgi:hypothetical protein